MTKKEFTSKYCLNSKITIEEFDQYFVTLPCRCGEDGCRGWAAVSKNPLDVKAHQSNCAPHKTEEDIDER